MTEITRIWEVADISTRRPQNQCALFAGGYTAIGGFKNSPIVQIVAKTAAEQARAPLLATSIAFSRHKYALQCAISKSSNRSVRLTINVRFHISVHYRHFEHLCPLAHMLLNLTVRLVDSSFTIHSRRSMSHLSASYQQNNRLWPAITTSYELIRAVDCTTSSFTVRSYFFPIPPRTLLGPRVEIHTTSCSRKFCPHLPHGH